MKSLDNHKILDEYATWLAVEKGRRPATREAYVRDINAFLSWLQKEHLSLVQVDSGTYENYISALRMSGMAESSVARADAALKGFFTYALTERYLDSDATASLKGIRRPRTLPKPLPEDGVIKLLDSISLQTPFDRRDAALLEFLYGTGCRVSELTGVTLSDLDFTELLVKVTGKGAKQRLVPIGSALLKALGEYLGSEGRPKLLGDHATGALFLNGRGNPLTRQGVDLIVRKRALAAGLSATHLSAHVFRHSCATHMLEHGADIRVVQELLGHASIATTQAYTALTASSLRREYLDAHPRANG